jgi:phospholipid/cholesterol/gamma-HCH transport system substrate-binding protein
MSEPTNHWKLGLFVVVGIGLAIAALAFIGTYSLKSDGVVYRSYFEEAVTGLESGAAVKFRGVTIGNVQTIGIAPDRKHVSVAYELDTPTVRKLGWAAGDLDAPRVHVPRDLRAQLASMGVTGMKYVQLDYFDSVRNPAPKLSFPTGNDHIPATPSTFASLEDSLLRFVDNFPAISERSIAVLEEVHGILAQMKDDKVPERAASTLQRMEETLTTVNAKLEALPVEELSESARMTAQQLNATLGQVQQVLARMDGDRGLLASVQRATDSVGDMAGRAHGMGNNLDATLSDFRELTQTMQSFLDTLERDSDMLIKGRAELPR